MSSFSVQNEAKKKFWVTPELIEKLLNNLDLESTVCLAQAHEVTQNVLQGTVVWNKLIRRSCPIDGLDGVKHLVNILKTLKDPEDHMMDLLEAICETNPAPAGGGDQHIAVRVGCPRHPHPDYHDVSLAGFMLLEEVEAAGLEDLEKCPACSFATIIPDKGMKVLVCGNPECGKETCRECREESHMPLACNEVERDEEVKILQLLLENASYKPNPEN